MKKIITLFTLFLSFTVSYAQEDALETAIKKQLNIASEEYFSFDLKTLPNDKNRSIAAITKYNGPEDDSGFECDLILLLIDNTTEKIIDQYIEEKKFSSDSYELSHVNLDMANYKVNEKTRAFGLRVGFSGSSRVYPSWDKSLSLFMIENNKIKLLLDQFPMDDLQGDWDTNCHYDGEKTNSIAIIQTQKTNGYFDILIKTTKTISTSRAPKKEGDPCIEKETKQKPTTQILKFVNGRYQVKKK